jgi:hypothetical protein
MRSHPEARDGGGMPETTRYEIVIRGRAGRRALRPLIDDFAIDDSADGETRLVGVIRDPSHLHGVLAHLTSVGIEVVRFGPHPGD